MINKIIYIALAIAIGAFIVNLVVNRTTNPVPPEEEESVMCTADAMMCPDGSYVGRTGPNCEFVCPEIPETDLTAEDLATMAEYSDLIVVDAPVPGATISSPVTITGQARGYWFFEASFPVTLTDWDGLIIAEGIATANGDWMTEDFVPFTATLTFDSPFAAGDPDFMQNGSLILKKDNPSGLPANDDALEYRIKFAP